MSEIRTQAIPTLLDFDSRRPTLDFVDALFLISAFLVPLDLILAASFTAYDFATVVLAFLILVGARRLQFLPRRFVPAIYFFLLFAVLGTFRASHPLEAVTQILVFVFIFFAQLPVILTLTKSQFVLRMGLLLFFGGALVDAAWALIFHQVQGSGRVLTFVSDNPNRLGYPTAYLLPFALYFLFDSWRQKRHLVIVLALPVFYILIWALAASASRSAAAGTVTGLIVFLSLRSGRKMNLKIVPRILSAVVVIALLSYLLYQTSYFPTTLRTRIDRTLKLEQSLVDDRGRLNIAGWLAFLDSPIIGVGLENFRYVAKEYLPIATNQPPHNIWIQFLSQIGLFGTLAFLALMIYWFLMVFKARYLTNDNSLRELLAAFIASMTAIMTIYLFLPIMDQRQYWMLYGLGLAVALSLGETQSQNAPAPHKHPGFYSPKGVRP